MSSEDLNKTISESTRTLAKAFLMWGFETLDTVQKLGAQAQEYVQELVDEAKTEQAAHKAKDENAQPQHQQVDETVVELVETASQEKDK